MLSEGGLEQGRASEIAIRRTGELDGRLTAQGLAADDGLQGGAGLAAGERGLGIAPHPGRLHPPPVGEVVPDVLEARVPEAVGARLRRFLGERAPGGEERHIGEARLAIRAGQGHRLQGGDLGGREVSEGIDPRQGAGVEVFAVLPELEVVVDAHQLDAGGGALGETPQPLAHAAQAAPARGQGPVGREVDVGGAAVATRGRPPLPLEGQRDEGPSALVASARLVAGAFQHLDGGLEEEVAAQGARGGLHEGEVRRGEVGVGEQAVPGDAVEIGRAHLQGGRTSARAAGLAAVLVVVHQGEGRRAVAVDLRRRPDPDRLPHHGVRGTHTAFVRHAIAVLVEGIAPLVGSHEDRRVGVVAVGEGSGDHAVAVAVYVTGDAAVAVLGLVGSSGLRALPRAPTAAHDPSHHHRQERAHRHLQAAQSATAGVGHHRAPATCGRCPQRAEASMAAAGLRRSW